MDMEYAVMDSPVGALLLAQHAAGLALIRFEAETGPALPEAGWRLDEAALAEAAGQLRAYFDGTLQTFDLPLAPARTPFQLDVWQALRGIPYGTTISYAELAHRIGRPQAVRAVGAANGQNPLPIVVPCHRVIGSDGSLTGYGGGLHIKQALLALERRISGSGGQQMALL